MIFKLKRKHFYIIEAQGRDEDQRELLQAKLKAKGIDCEVTQYQLEIHEVEKNE